MILNDLRKNISDLINESQLPIDAVYYVMKDIMSEIITIYNQQIEMENAAAAQTNVEQGQTDEEPTAASSENIEKEEK
mgnify:CR=1 FL=1